MIYFAKWKIVLILALCALGTLYAAPNLLGRQQARELAQTLPAWLPTRQISLGLDLRGGSHLLLRVEWEAVLTERLDSLVDTLRSHLRGARNEAAGTDRLSYTNLGVAGQAVTLTLTDPAGADRLREIVRDVDRELVLTVDAGGVASIRYSDAALDQLRTNAVNQSIEIVRRRIDELGTSEPSIQRQGEDRILLQMPGLGDWRTTARDRMDELLPRIRSALDGAGIGTGDIRTEDLVAHVALTDPASAERATAALGGLGEPIAVSAEPGGLAVTFTQAYVEGLRNDVERVRSLLGQTARLSFQLIDANASLAEAMAGRVPPGSAVLPSAETGPNGQPARQYVVRRRVNVTGDTLTDAQPSFQEGRPIVSFSFDSLGARRFAETTRDNVGRQLAIVLDGKVISAPVIRSAILGGHGIIEGGFTVQSASDLALLLRAGALPAPMTVLEERTVGPGLGADSIAAGTTAALTGFALVVAFMLVSYGLFGVMANVALVFNMILIFALLSVLGATLTLPGIAGIALTIGMAVDANVLIFERIREEQRHGRSPISAIDAGYSRAMTTIIDSNLTTLIATLLLFLLGSGPVRGFAVTLTIGIVVSMFTAIMLTRLMVVTWLRRVRPKAIPI